MTTAAIAVGFSAVTLLGPAPAAVAADKTPTAGNTGTIHCLVQVYPIEVAGSARTPTCFDTKAEVAAAFDDIVSSAAQHRESAAAATTLLGTTYSDQNSGGNSLAYWGANGCAGVTYGFAAMPAGWSNNVSSARGSNGCWLTVYSATSYGGGRLNCTPYCSTVYGMNDAVKSMVFRPTGTFG